MKQVKKIICDNLEADSDAVGKTGRTVSSFFHLPFSSSSSSGASSATAPFSPTPDRPTGDHLRGFPKGFLLLSSGKARLIRRILSPQFLLYITKFLYLDPQPSKIFCFRAL